MMDFNLIDHCNLQGLHDFIEEMVSLMANVRREVYDCISQFTTFFALLHITINHYQKFISVFQNFSINQKTDPEFPINDMFLYNENH